MTAPYVWPTVDEVLTHVPIGDTGPFIVTELPGGLTNRNYRAVGVGGTSVVVRLTSPQSGALTIDREMEFANAGTAAAGGVAPAVLGRSRPLAATVIEWIDGKTLEPSDLDDSAMIRRLAEVCRQLHRGAPFSTHFDMFEVQRRYLDLVLAAGYRLPARYLDFAAQVRRVELALAALAGGTVPCHNDLLAANILDDGERLWLIDFEYSGNNDPCFELGNLWSEATLPPDRLEELVTAYLGGYSAVQVARARLFGLMSKYGWTLWASIQDATSDVDFDFWSWGMEKYERAVAEFDGPDFERLLDAAQAPP
jgi:thiamine kinase-like enzyme